jgi:hypothetical protein
VFFARRFNEFCGICRKNGFDAPSLWTEFAFDSDDKSAGKILSAVKGEIKEDISFVCAPASEDFEQHVGVMNLCRKASLQISAAAALQTGNRMWYDHEVTMQNIVPVLNFCRKNKLESIYFTMSSDGGACCDFDSAFAGAVTAFDMAYGEKDVDNTAERFEAATGTDYDIQIAAGAIDCRLSDEYGNEYELSAGALLWDDPLYGAVYENFRRFDPEFDLKLLDNCEELLCAVMSAIEDKSTGDVEHAVNILQLLVKKIELRGALRIAYDSGDRLGLREVAVHLVPGVIAAVREFNASFRRQWLKRAKPFGLEQMQQRNAALIARLEECAVRVREYLDGSIDSIEELEERVPHSQPSAESSFWSYEKAFSGTVVLRSEVQE